MKPRLDRLRKVVEALRGVKMSRFDMDQWKRETICGSTCCAVGHYIEKNNRCGLKLVKDNYGNYSVSDGQGSSPMLAVGRHFGIHGDAVRHLFTAGVEDDPSADPPSPATIRGRIERFITDYDKCWA